MNDLPKSFPPYKKVDHKIEMAPSSTLPSKAPYKLNQKELEELKTQINDLLSWGILNKACHLMGH